MGMFQFKNKNWQTKTEHYYWRTLALIMVGDFFIGLGFLLNAQISPAFDIAQAIMPLHHWGAVAFIGAATALIGLYAHNRMAMLVGISAGAFYTIFIALTLGFGFVTGLNGFTGVVWWLVVGLLHLMAALGLPNTATIKRLRDGI